MAKAYIKGILLDGLYSNLDKIKMSKKNIIKSRISSII